MASEKSPVTGKGFKPLSKSYAAYKKATGADAVPNLEDSGDMLGALDFKSTPSGLEIGVYGSEAPKADGHNNLSGKSRIPERRFIPDVGESFRPQIRDEIQEIVDEVLAESAEIREEDLEDVATRSDLYALLESQFPDMFRSQIRVAVLANSKLSRMLIDFDLLDLL